MVFSFKYVFIIFCFISPLAHADPVYGTFVTFGPNVQYYFGNKNSGWGFGFEVGFWNNTISMKQTEYFGFDIGVEKFKDKAIFYSEIQVSNGIIGESIGPVIEFDGDRFNLGIQSTTWIGVIGYLDFRGRYMQGDKFNFSPGCFARLGIPLYE